MNKDKQIENMVKDIFYSEEDFQCSCFATDKEECDSCPDEHPLNCKAYHIAKSLYTIGYRKASEIAEEILEELKKAGITENRYPVIAELKKKYKEET